MNGPTEQIKPTPVKAGGTECGRITDLESRPPTTPRLIASCHM